MVNGKMEVYGAPKGFTSQSPMGGCPCETLQAPLGETQGSVFFPQRKLNMWTVGVVGGTRTANPFRLLDNPLCQLSHSGHKARERMV